MRRIVVLTVALVVMISAVATAQTWNEDPTFGSVELNAGFVPDPNTVELTAGGNVDLSGRGFSGYVADAPDFNLTYEANGSWPLVIRAESDSDLVLLVNAPDGSWHYNDDYSGYGFNSAVVFENPQSGLYNIWVGTYGSSTAPATLYISELESW
ncbi:MAG: hypothetical protein ACLFNQ_07640 [Spirochaetaceae bacterium]